MKQNQFFASPNSDQLVTNDEDGSASNTNRHDRLFEIYFNRPAIDIAVHDTEAKINANIKRILFEDFYNIDDIKEDTMVVVCRTCQQKFNDSFARCSCVQYHLKVCIGDAGLTYGAM